MSDEKKPADEGEDPPEEDHTGGSGQEKMSRREFLKLGGVAAAGVAGFYFLGSAAMGTLQQLKIGTDPRSTKRTGDERWVMVIDLALCDGCKLCLAACRKEHFLLSGQEWIRIYEPAEVEEMGAPHFPRPCMHCDNPPCLNVCPVGATFKKVDGTVLVDQDRCIGCRFCIAACPYNARNFIWTEPKHTPEELAHEYSPEEPWPHRKGVTEKCIWCPHKTEKGELPVCVTTCPMGAVYFGDERQDAVTNSKGETLSLQKLKEDSGAFRYKAELGTKPRVWYLPYRKPPGEAGKEGISDG